MDGVGDEFGEAIDAVLRRPRAASVPLLIDVIMLAIGTLLFASIAGVRLLFPQGYRLPNLRVAIPHALPSVGDIMGPTPAVHDFGLQTIVAAVVLVVATIPLLAYCEAGFLGVLRRVYLTPHDAVETGYHADAWVRISAAFQQAGQQHFVAFLVLRGVQGALALAVLVMPLLLPSVGDYGLGVFAVDLLLLFAPYAAIERGQGAVAAMRESLQLVSDHLAPTLVALLFGFLLTGGMAILVAPLVSLLGVAAPFVASLLYAPVGTALSLFLYRIYLRFTRAEALPEAAPAPDSVAVGA